MIKRIFEVLTTPPYLRKDYDPSQVSNRQRRFWIFNLWGLALGYMYYMFKDRAAKRGCRVGRARRGGSSGDDELDTLLDNAQNFYHELGVNTVMDNCTCYTPLPGEEHEIDCKVWELIELKRDFQTPDLQTAVDIINGDV